MLGHATQTTWPDHLLRVGDLTSVGLGELLDLAAAMKAAPDGWTDAHRGEALACFFDAPTTGLTVSSATAAARLGLMPVVLPRQELLHGSGEPLADIARTFSSAAAALLVHTIAHRVLREVATAASVPVVNALSDEHRPCQALADLLTLRERFGGLEGLVLAFVGDCGDGAAHSLAEAGALTGMEVRLACPPEHRPLPEVRIGAETLADLHGGRVWVTEDPREAVAGADVVYTVPWVPPHRRAEREERLERLRRYQVHRGLMELTEPRAVFMHPLPAHRGEEVAAQIVDGARSVVWQQAANRVPAAQASIHVLLSDVA